MKSIRELKELDREAVKASLSRALSRPDKAWIGTVDFDLAIEKIYSGEFLSHIVDETYLVLSTPMQPWYSKDKILLEIMVLRIYPGPGRFSSVPQALEGIARVVGATGITVGTQLAESNRALVRMYQRAGFREDTRSLYKQIKE